jgi:hypothetical protein
MSSELNIGPDEGIGIFTNTKEDDLFGEPNFQIDVSPFDGFISSGSVENLANDIKVDIGDKVEKTDSNKTIEIEPLKKIKKKKKTHTTTV